MGTLSCSIQDLVPWPGIKPRPPALEMWQLSPWITKEVSDIFFNRHIFLPQTLIIQGDPWLLKPLFQVPSQFCVLHKAGCSSSTIIPLLGSRRLSPHQTSCHLFHFVLYDFLTLSCSQMTFCMFILFPDFFFFTTYQREAGNQNFLSNYYGLIPCLVLYNGFIESS